MIVHLIDGTYELFRHFFAVPSRRDPSGREIGAVRGVVDNVLRLLEDGATHVGVATDHVIESFRNDLYPGYKTGAGIDPELRSQFEPLEDALRALGVTVWAMVEHEADDALGAAAAVAAGTAGVTQVQILTPDKDLAQCVRDPVIVQIDRRKSLVMDEAAVEAKFGVTPSQIPDYLALVGDSADGFPGVPGFGAKSAAAVLTRYGTIDAIPDDPAAWDVPGVRGAARLAVSLAGMRDEALVFRDLATIRTHGPEVGEVSTWRWSGPTDAFEGWAQAFGMAGLTRRAQVVADRRAGVT